ncbi:MAG: hypothetical protein QXM43_03635 [Desulfurococcaceae archaeon]
MNDTVFIYIEDKPSIRGYVQQVPLYMAILARIIYIFFICFLITHYYFTIDGLNIIQAILLLSFSFLMHNIQKVKLNRIFTFSLIRLSRLIFIPFIISGSQIVPYILLVILPYFIAELVINYNWQLSKYDIKIPKMNWRMSFIFLIFLPFQAVLLYPNLLTLSGNIIVIISCFISEHFAIRYKLKKVMVGVLRKRNIYR